MGANTQAVGVRMELAIQLFCERTDEDERSTISDWLKALLAIRQSTRSDWQKARDAWEETRRKRILRRMLKRLADLAYAWGWRNLRRQSRRRNRSARRCDWPAAMDRTWRGRHLCGDFDPGASGCTHYLNEGDGGGNERGGCLAHESERFSFALDLLTGVER